MQQSSLLPDNPLFQRTPSYVEALNEANFYLKEIQAAPSKMPGTVTAKQVNNNTDQPLVTVTAGGCPGKQINATDVKDAAIEVYDKNPFETVNPNVIISDAGA